MIKILISNGLIILNFNSLIDKPVLRSLVTISSFLLFILVFAPAEAQLITDSKAKLKTSKIERNKSFLFFNRKTGKSQNPPSTKRAKTSPRYSNRTAFASKKYTSPRYSQGSIGSFFRNIKIRPKYSTAAVGSSQNKRPAPAKYSKPVSWKGTRYAGIPRVSRPVNWKGTPSLEAPRLSKPVNWKGAWYAGIPRTSKPVNWKGTRYAGTPRYSKSVNWKGSAFAGSPRYSRPVNWKGTPSFGTPRYSKPVNWRGTYSSGPTRYSSFKHRFDVDERQKHQSRPYEPWLAKYSGFAKYEKPNHKNMHPSVNYLTAKNISSKAIKKGLRKWNIFWVRLNPGKLSAPGLRNVAKKAKFDKREKDIWNNGRDKKPTTRNDSTASTAEPVGAEESTEKNR